MKTTATIEMKNMSQGISVSTPSALLARMNKMIMGSRFALTLAAIISFIMNEEISASKSMHLLHACVAGLCAFFLGGFSWLIQIILLVWFAATVWQCHKDGWK